MPRKPATLSILIVCALTIILSSCSPPPPSSPEENNKTTQTTHSSTATQSPTSTKEPPSPTEQNSLLTLTPTSSLELQPEDLNGIRIQFWHPWTTSRENWILNLVNQFNAENEYGITVTAFSHGGDLFQDVRAAVNIGEPPELTLGYNNQLIAWYSQDEPLVDLNEYVNDPIWGLDETEQADFYAAIWDQDVVDGVRLGLPFYRSSQVIFYNQSWARELGFDDPPTNADAFEEQACAAAQEKDDGRGGWILSTETSALLSWIYAFGGEIVEPRGDGYRFDTSQVETALTFLRGLLDQGCAWEAETRYPNPEFATRQALFYTSSVAGLPFQVEAFEEAGQDDEWTPIPFPSSSDQPVITIYGLSTTIFKSTPEAQLAAWLFARWLSQPENQAQWVEISSYYPTRASTLDHLSDYIEQNPRFGAALELISYSQIEPRLASWGTVRWAVSDAAEQVFDLDFDPGQIPTVVEDLNATAEEIHAQSK